MAKGKRTTIRNAYYVKTYTERITKRHVAGDFLPDPKKGPYCFINCTMHPRVWNSIRSEYKGCWMQGGTEVYMKHKKKKAMA